MEIHWDLCFFSLGINERDPQENLRDLRKLLTESRQIGLELTNDKSDFIIFGSTIEERDAVGDLFDQCTSGIRRIPFSEATILGFRLGGGGAGRVLMEKVTALERMRLNLKGMNSEQSLPTEELLLLT